MRHRGPAALGALALIGLMVLAGPVDQAQSQPASIVVQVDLGEWAVLASPPGVPAGVPVRFVATNVGTITHALRIDGLNAQTGLLAPGESATLDIVFAAPGPATLFCPVGGGSHRQRGMETALEVSPPPAGQTVQATPGPPPTPTAAPLTSPGADVDRVGLPEGYRELFPTFYVFDRADNRQVRHVYANPIGTTARDGQPYPYGTILVMETWRAQLTQDNQIARGADGRYIRDELTGIFIMRKERGFGEKYGADRTGEWEFVAYRPDGSYLTRPEFTQACAQCHQATSSAQLDWVVRGNLFFAGRAAQPPLPAALPRTGATAAGLSAAAQFGLGAAAFAVLGGLAAIILAKRR